MLSQIVGLLLLLVLVLGLAAWKRRRVEPEAAYFDRVVDALRADDPGATWEALTLWVSKVRPESPTAVRDFAESSHDPGLYREISLLDRHLFGPEGDPCRSHPWTGRGLLNALPRVRRRMRRARELP